MWQLATRGECTRERVAHPFVVSRPHRDPASAISSEERLPSIAVLPFANLSGDKDQEYFSDGLAEEIINALAKIPRLKVIARHRRSPSRDRTLTSAGSPRRWAWPEFSKAACGARAIVSA